MREFTSHARALGLANDAKKVWSHEATKRDSELAVIDSNRRWNAEHVARYEKEVIELINANKSSERARAAEENLRRFIVRLDHANVEFENARDDLNAAHERLRVAALVYDEASRSMDDAIQRIEDADISAEEEKAMCLQMSNLPNSTYSDVYTVYIERRKRRRMNAMLVPCTTNPEADTCAVCTESLAKGALSRVAACTHVFHTACVSKWIEDHETCPTCRSAPPAERPAPIFPTAVGLFGPTTLGMETDENGQQRLVSQINIGIVWPEEAYRNIPTFGTSFAAGTSQLDPEPGSRRRLDGNRTASRARLGRLRQNPGR